MNIFLLMCCFLFGSAFVTADDIDDQTYDQTVPIIAGGVGLSPGGYQVRSNPGAAEEGRLGTATSLVGESANQRGGLY